ncbi:MAG: 3-dehydroquinate synthase [bacterium]|nr:3-dehydroquinate synthase [bacterium]
MASLKSIGYKIIIEEDSFKALTAFLKQSNYSATFILCDENTLKHCLPTLITQVPKLRQAEIIEIEAGELSKAVEICVMICQTLIEQRADRNVLLLNLGGGVVSDLGGFTASVYKRGISFVHLPTSLLAMADASVGGKTGIDLNGIKNCIGTFAQPDGVFINPSFLNTLPERHFKNGLAEIIKIALVYDKPFWNRLKKPISAKELVEKSVSLKNKIVLKDPYDKGLRNILNFGHTIGHAVEGLLMNSKEPLLHGEAISIGMIVESHLALQKKLLSRSDYSEVIATLCTLVPAKALHSLSFDSILSLLTNDKKTSGKKVRFSLITGIGSCKTDVVVSDLQIRKAIDAYHSLTHV